MNLEKLRPLTERGGMWFESDYHEMREQLPALLEAIDAGEAVKQEVVRLRVVAHDARQEVTRLRAAIKATEKDCHECGRLFVVGQKCVTHAALMAP